MSKRKSEKRFAGLDVSKDVLDLWAGVEGCSLSAAQFGNTAAGHRQLVRSLLKGKHQARVVLEATGTYSFDVALALHEAGVEVMVVNPKASHHFAEALMQRTRTDATAAEALREFALRMDFVAWTPPSVEARELRDIARRIDALSREGAAEKNRLHALEASSNHSRLVAKDIRASIKAIQRRIARLLVEARRVIEGSAELEAPYRRLRTFKGFGHLSAVRTLGELLTLPPDMTAKQWVAHAGLNPCMKTSGTSVHKKPRVSKQGNARLRAALYMPALVARHHNPNVRAYADNLAVRGKAKLQVIVAVMRKLLHAIHGMLSSNSDFDGEKFYRTLPKAA